MDKFYNARRRLCGLIAIALGVLCTLASSTYVVGAAPRQVDPPPDYRLTYLPFIARPDPVCDATAFRKGPQLVFSGSNTEMKVVWQLDTTLPSTLQWGEDLHYPLGATTTTETGPEHQHSYIISGLSPGTRYYYRIFVGMVCSLGSFYTAPADTAANLKFFAYGDTRNGISTQNAIAGQVIGAYTADPAFQTFNLHVGDVVSNGDLESAWMSELYDPHYLPLRTLLANISYLPVMGNHEGSGGLFTRYFPMPFVADRFWSFNYGPAHIVMLDQYVPYTAGTAQYIWLANDLAASTKMWKFIVLHEPGWSATGDHVNNPLVQTVIQPLAEQYGVSIVFGGHNHFYARAVVNGVQHLTVGGGGAPLHIPDPSALYVVAAEASYSFAEIAISGNVLNGVIVRANGTIIETFTVTR